MFETDYLKSKNLFKKTEVSLVESNKIENTQLQCKAAISEANVKTNRMLSAK